MRLVEVTFFTGLIGCTIVVFLSWISVGKDALTRDTEAELHPMEPELKTRGRSRERF